MMAATTPSPATATEDAATTVEGILTRCLTRLRRLESKELFMDVLRSEWYGTVADLVLALEDGKAWSDLKLPGRLKLEIKSELLALQSSQTGSGGGGGKSEGGIVSTPDPSNQWMKYFSAEHSTYFYCNVATHASQWEEPTGPNVEIFEDYDSSSSAEVSPTSTKNGVGIKKRAGATAKSKRALEKDDSDDDDDDDDDEEDEEDEEDDEVDHEEEEEAIWRALLRSMGSGGKPTAAELVHDATDAPSSAHKKSDIIVVSEAYVVPEEVTVGIVEASSSSSSSSSSSAMADLHRSDSERSVSLEDLPAPPRFGGSSFGGRGGRTAAARRDRGSSPAQPDPVMAQRLVDMGFAPSAVASALRRSDNNLSAAASFLLANRRPSSSEPEEPRERPSRDMSSAAAAARRVAARMGLPRIFPPPSAPPPYTGLR